MPLTTLKLESLNKKINADHIIKNINLELHSGNLITLLGHNGAGKTTLFKLITKLLAPTSGTVRILQDNNQITNDRNMIGYIEAEPFFYEELTGVEHIEFITELFNIPNNTDEIKRLSTILNLDEYDLNKKVNEYSLGMKKKLALISTLIRKPKILLLDEYISGLDPVTLKRTKEILTDLKKNTLIILSTHQLEVVQTFCDKIVLMNEGTIEEKVTDINKIIEEFDTLENYFMFHFDK
ncbi:TPA: ABC transporter ATP-binding protein [Bacillus cereus]|nr:MULTISPECIES: ABC transporter ATP-binding protein [Bacillus cereus group]ARV91089.1 hypothetical protein BJG91_01825 [Bacillus thuringiensis]MCC2363993.1 ABC transporter ATP-binding protein [Bacillus cereus]MDA2550185.1 ABC transporter ATP-binding protein [Bacillus cereus]MDA2555698.1 ABC transporter ATP-binding protein [Bacillus cereus]MEB9660274.1 ABC transporter ATP-binding protein [Bacillus cereus]